jgi:ribosomal protein L37AE/L43A
MEYVIGILLACCIIGLIGKLSTAMQHRAIRNAVTMNFLVQPCPRCHENLMKLIGISPNGRSVQYQCNHCGKKMHGAAASPDAPNIIRLSKGYKPSAKSFILFETTLSPLPYEQTSRTPIPEATRSEVWRRDGGCCVNCGCKQNLQFDHIIPVSRGGSTSAQNLQLLCQQCNHLKGVRI